MVEVIVKLQEAAEKAKQAASKLEADASGEVAEDVAGACKEYEAAAVAVQDTAQAAGISAPGLSEAGGGTELVTGAPTDATNPAQSLCVLQLCWPGTCIKCE